MKRTVSAVLSIVLLLFVVAFPSYASGVITDLSHYAYWETVFSDSSPNTTILGIPKGTETKTKIMLYGDDAVALNLSSVLINPVYHNQGKTILPSECGWTVEVESTTTYCMNDELGMSVGLSECNATIKNTKSRSEAWSVSLNQAQKYSINSEVINNDAPTGYYAVMMGEPVNLYCYQETVKKIKNGAIISNKVADMYLPTENTVTSVYIVFSSDGQQTWEIY